jgi:Skp family chaperone for outer membrane proteins
MARSAKSIALTLAALSLLGAGVVGGQLVSSAGAAAAAGRAPTQPSIAIVDMEKIFNGMAMRATREGELKTPAEGLQGEMDKLGKAVQDEQAKLSLLPDGRDKQAAQMKMLEMQANARVKKELFEAQIELRRSEMFRDMYEKINTSVAKYAQQNGYTIVISSDEGIRVPEGVQTSEIQRFISLRRLMFVDQRHDITAEVITMLNNEASAGK